MYRLEKVFLILENSQNDVILSGTVLLNETNDSLMLSCHQNA